MEFSSLLAAGATGGVLAALLLRLVWRTRVSQQTDPGEWREAQFLILHAAWGVGLGLLFWLSWGLTAIVGVSWWLRGAIFGLLCGGVLAVPILWLGRVLLAWRWRTLSAVFADALGTSILAGLLCAWSWAHGA